MARAESDAITEQIPEVQIAIRKTLKIVDIIFETLLDEIQVQLAVLDKLPREERIVMGLGPLIRLTIQKQILEALRTGIPDAVLYDDPRILARIIAVVGKA